jgi:Tol biopolymer transport system component
LPLSDCDGAPITINPEWSPDGQRLLFLHEVGTSIMDADGSHAHTIPLVSNTEWLSFGPDGGHAVYSAGDLEPEIWTAKLNGRQLHRVGTTSGRAPRWSADGSMIAYLADDGVRIVNAQTGEPARWFASATYGRATSVDWSPDARRLLWASSAAPGTSTRLWIAPVDGSRAPRVVTGVTGNKDVGVAWSPNGRRIAFVVSSRRDRKIAPFALWTMSAQGTNRHRLYRGRYRTHREFAPSVFRPSVSWGPRPSG